MDLLTDTYTRRCDLIRVVDGDTVWLDVDAGYHMHVRAPFRFARINAPEVRGADKAEGLIAKQALVDLLVSARELHVMSIKTEKYGRWLCELWVVDADGNEINVNDWMVSSGHAVYE